MPRKYETSAEAEMHGGAMQAFVQNLNADNVKPFLDEVLDKYGYSELDPETWYPSQMALDLYRALAEKGGNYFNLVAIGMQFVETAPFPDEVNSIPTAMHALNAGYEMSIRNYPEDEGYAIENVSDRHVQVTETAPYPHDIMYGYIYGLSRRFCPEDGDMVVERTFMNEDEPDAGGAVYDITW